MHKLALGGEKLACAASKLSKLPFKGSALAIANGIKLAISCTPDRGSLKSEWGG